MVRRQVALLSAVSTTLVAAMLAAVPSPAVAAGLPQSQSDVWGGSCDSAATGTVYNVGPGQANASVGSVPWLSLGPGDRVNIHARPAAYKEKILIVGQGTSNAPITVCGVPDAQGNRPVIDGNGATTRPGMVSDFAATANRGVITFAAPEDTPYGTKPRYVVIDGLEVTGAYGGNTFTDHAGVTTTYPVNAAGIFVERGQWITVRDTVIRGNANGLFVASASDNTTDMTSHSAHILVEGNHFTGNGTTGSDQQHSSYIAAEDVVYQFNRYDELRAGAGGADLKDRSAGTVARFNWFNGGGRALDLVDSEDSPLIASLPSYRQTWAYGNVIDVKGDDRISRAVHYGGDTGDASLYRKGTLYFFNNTVVVQQNREDATPAGPNYSMQLFTVETTQETIEVWNNAVLAGPSTPGQAPVDFFLYRNSGTYHLGGNVFSDNINVAGNPAEANGVITGANEVTKVQAGSFGFGSVASGDYRPSAGSPLVDSGVAAPVGIPARHALAFQYHQHAQADGRPVNGAGVDIGALESGPVTELPDSDVIVNLSVPVITGAARVGSMLTASSGGWTNNPTGFDYAWQSGGAPVGANQNTYTPVADDVDKTVTVTVTARRTDYTSGSATSAPTPAITLGGATLTPRQPVVSGTPRVGKKLTMSVQQAPAGYQVALRWLRGTKLIKGATTRAYRPVRKDRGKKIYAAVIWYAPDQTVTYALSKPKRIK